MIIKFISAALAIMAAGIIVNKVIEKRFFVSNMRFQTNIGIIKI